MTASSSSPLRLYLMQVATITDSPTITSGPDTLPVPCYLIQTKDGKNILIDSGYPRTEKKEEVVEGAVILHGNDVIWQLATIGVRPADIDLLICTHFHDDHAGNNGAFPNARLVVQRLQYEVARAGDPRFADCRQQWDQPASRYQLLDGDTELFPGVELIETSGHVPGHQSVLVHLPKTGLVLLAGDAVTFQTDFTADRPVGPSDDDGVGASIHKLLELSERKHVSLVIFGHDGRQWATLKQLPDFFD